MTVKRIKIMGIERIINKLKLSNNLFVQEREKKYVAYLSVNMGIPHKGWILWKKFKLLSPFFSISKVIIA